MQEFVLRPTLEASETWERIVVGIRRLPTLPSVVFELQRVIQNVRSSAMEVGRIISSDQVLTTRVLRLVNSAYHGLPRQVHSVTEAVTLLGLEQVKSMALALSVHDMFATGRYADGLDRAQLWRHSLAVANCARLVAKEAALKDPEQAFTAGLLHDVGKVVFDQYAHAQFIEALQASAGGMPLHQAEAIVLGAPHTRVGQMVLSRWKLPEFIPYTAMHHHSPGGSSEHLPVCACVTVGNAVAKWAGYALPTDKVVPRLSKRIMQMVNMSQEKAGAIAERLDEGMAESADFLQALQGK